MKNIFYYLLLVAFLSIPNALDAQETSSIRAYKNAANKTEAKKPVKAYKVLELPHISLYVYYSESHITTELSRSPSGFVTYGDVNVSDTFWYCLRPGEEIATIVSWTFKTQVNKNNIFRKNATEYFKDYPELSKKIEDKDLKHDDIIQVVEEYNNWKSGK
ncbi:hypothetical protein [Moheibacter lacus]|uniref:Uncharacterized protein n=1 Tax=Moheibacter lacus TaxID=2745851 RepID=A0A838ZL06_9FLAO|nr:hypothetical protein [Moheibacter lacus]MBA5629104.1 hypothetical protein [Moheibacter lacus]